MKSIYLFLLLLFLSISTVSFATVTFRLDFASVPNENAYFFCMPNTGCFSILDGKKGKTYPILHHVGISSIYIMDVTQDMRVFPQPLPNSCMLSKIDNKTITISGELVKQDDVVYVKGLSCQVSG